MYFEVNDVSKSYGKNLILDAVSFGLNKGDSLAIAGCNGSGKSTLLSILAGAATCDSGKILVDGKELSKKEIGKAVDYVPQSSPFIDEMTVRDNLNFWYSGNKNKLKDDFESGMLKDFGLKKYMNYKVGTLSGGMKKRLSIATALVDFPPVMLLDEPGAALDLVCKKDILKYLDEYRRKGGIVILSSHEEAELKFCNNILMIKGKKLVPVDFMEIENEIRKQEN